MEWRFKLVPKYTSHKQPELHVPSQLPNYTHFLRFV
jgi:hypothetical protein